MTLTGKQVKVLKLIAQEKNIAISDADWMKHLEVVD